MGPGAKTSLAPPCSNLRSFGSKYTVLNKVLETWLGRFGAPHSDFAPRELCPLATPLSGYANCVVCVIHTWMQVWTLLPRVPRLGKFHRLVIGEERGTQD